ncbi:MAG: hypothetical protein F4205_05775 [Gemmatimonadetes bacterium]|nr:hypothetical protein [Gemmatimonadota bacterium]MYG34985.1 hypothetical protein [Gemmatimonadota bacterium]
MRQPTEDEKVVIDLILSGVSEFDVPKRIGITWAEYAAWYGDGTGTRAELIRQAKRDYTDSQERLPPEDRAGHAENAILRFKQKIVNDEVQRIIGQSQE